MTDNLYIYGLQCNPFKPSTILTSYLVRYMTVSTNQGLLQCSKGKEQNF